MNLYFCSLENLQFTSCGCRWLRCSRKYDSRYQKPLPGGGWDYSLFENAPFNMCCCSSLSDQTWKKFGDATDDNPKGPDQATTVIADDVYLTLTTNKEVSIIPLIECTVTRRGVKESSLWWVLCNILVLVKGWEEWMERICMYIHAYMFARDYECVVNGSGPMAAYWG